MLGVYMGARNRDHRRQVPGSKPHKLMSLISVLSSFCFGQNTAAAAEGNMVRVEIGQHIAVVCVRL